MVVKLTKYNIFTHYNITNYKINPDKTVDGDVDLSYRKLTKIPIKFGKVSGRFNCSYNNLTSLKGCPSYVGENFSCQYNNLTSLQHTPEYINSYFNCSHNKLVSLQYFPNYVGRVCYLLRTTKRHNISFINSSIYIFSTFGWKF